MKTMILPGRHFSDRIRLVSDMSAQDRSFPALAAEDRLPRRRARTGRLALSLLTSLAVALSLLVSGLNAMTPLHDDEMSLVTGQALMQMSKERGTNESSHITFYKAGLDAVLELNMNIRKLQLGCGGVNGAVGCDLDADRFALGCLADASGNCTMDPGSQAQLRSFVMTRPYFQFAVTNDDTKTLREVVGIRLGGESVEGPMSIGNFNTFSGYLSASADFIMEAQGTDENDDIAVTCGRNGPPCPGDRPGDGYNTFGLQGPLRSLGLENGCACVLTVCAEFKDLTIGFPSVSRLDRPVVLSGNRQTQAYVYNAQLASAVDTLVDNMQFIRSNGGFLTNPDLLNLVKGLIATNVKNNIKGQLAAGFGIPAANLESYVIPYNISNLHSVEVNSSLFGLSFQKEPVRYPGYASAMPVGWSMYLPDAFKLSVSEPTTVFVNNIMQGNAAAGNIVPLPNPGSGAIYDNCWGHATFC